MRSFDAFAGGPVQPDVLSIMNMRCILSKSLAKYYKRFQSPKPLITLPSLLAHLVTIIKMAWVASALACSDQVL
jgi:hypothetical protein